MSQSRQKHDYSTKNIQTRKLTNSTRKKQQQQLIQSSKKQVSVTVKQLVNKLTQKQSKKINKKYLLDNKVNSLVNLDNKINTKSKKHPSINVPIQQPQRIELIQQNNKKKIQYSQEDIKRIKFLKKLHSEKAILQKRQRQKMHQQQLQRQKQQQKKKQQQQRLKHLQQQNKKRTLSLRLQQIQRRKQQRKKQLLKQNKEYLLKKSQFTLQHKLVNQWLEKQLQQNQIKERQLQAKISKMKPTNLLSEIQQHMELIESYKKLHQSRFMDSDLKYQQYKSRLSLSKLYKSNWYKQIQENDPLETFQIEEQKKKQQKLLLLMKLDNKKKYSQYVKVNYKPDSDQQSVFKYEKRIIADISADKIRRMGLQNLDYSKQHAHSKSQKKFHPQTERDNLQQYKNYLKQLKTQRLKKQEISSNENFDHLIEKIKQSTTLTKDEKVKKITQLARKMQKKAKQKEQVFNRTNQKGMKLLQKQTIENKNMRRGSSLPSLTVRTTSQPKLKISQHKTSKKNQSTDQLLQQIQSKLKLLQKVGNL